ncbi:MAG: protein kinase [Anaerolineales bacterium]|nr:protein kinase [Anaerolineales bacterium]
MSVILSARYQLLEVMGETPYSAVHRAFDTRLQRMLAVHVLQGQDAPFVAEMTAWLQQMGQVRHPAIAQVTDFDMGHEPPYFVLELGTEPPPAVAKMADLGAFLGQFVAVAQGLAYAHERGIVHGRVHERSILYKANLEPDRPQLFVTDLALPVWAGETVPEKLRPYFAPEQWRGDTAVAESDVYSFGVLLYERIAGQRPFTGEQQTQPTPPAHQLRAEVPLEVSALLADMLSLEIAGRPTMRTVGARLAELAEMVAQYAPAEGGWQVVVTYDDTAGGATHRELFALAEDVTAWQIGSAKSCAVRLTGRAIWPEHVRVVAGAEGRWLVEDLGSEQGTFLQGQRLVAGRPEVWLGGDVLQVGGYQVRWQKAWGAEDTAVWRETNTAVQVQIQPATQTVSPGERCFFEIDLLNQGTSVTHCALQISGLPSHWVTLSGQLLQLLPQAHATVQLTVQPPRTHAALAQTYPFQILLAVTGQKAAREAAVGELTLRPFVALRSDIQPQQLVNEGVCYLTVFNEGNARALLTTTGRDGPGVLLYEGLPQGAAVVAGGSQMFAVRVKHPRRPWVGASQTTPFVLTNTLALADDPAQVVVQANGGRVEARPRVSRWLLTAVFSCLILFCIMGFFITTSYTNNRQAVTSTVQAVSTERALEATLTAAARAVEEAQTPRPTPPPTLTPIPLFTLTPAEP